MESKAHERIDLLITASLNIYQTKKCIPIIMKKCFSEGKLIKHFVNTPFLREPLSFHFQLNPLSLNNFFMTSLFVQILKTRNCPNFRGRKLCIHHTYQGLF